MVRFGTLHAVDGNPPRNRSIYEKKRCPSPSQPASASPRFLERRCRLLHTAGFFSTNISSESPPRPLHRYRHRLPQCIQVAYFPGRHQRCIGGQPRCSPSTRASFFSITLSESAQTFFDCCVIAGKPVFLFFFTVTNAPTHCTRTRLGSKVWLVLKI
jgi:hypothetical protein